MQNDNNTSPTVKLITALIGLLFVACFVFGLSYSISTGFAGFEGGLPFAIITLIVILMVLYDVWEECIRKR